MSKYEIWIYIGLALVDISVFMGFGAIAGILILGIFVAFTGFFKLID